jgi:hypothetical protein
VGIIGANAQQNQKTFADLAVDFFVNGDGRVSHAGNNCAHMDIPFVRPLNSLETSATRVSSETEEQRNE